MSWNAAIAAAGSIAALGALSANELPVSKAERRTTSFLRDDDRDAAKDQDT